MGYTMIFETKIVNLSDGRLIHFDRSGCNNDNEGRRSNEWNAKIYTKQEFRNRIESFKRDSKPYKECQPHEWELKIYGRVATGYDYGMHLERMQKRAMDFKDFIAEKRVAFNLCDEIELLEPEMKLMSYKDFEKYRREQPITEKIRYRIWYKSIDLNNEAEVTQAIESGKPLEIIIEDRSPVMSNKALEYEENTENSQNEGMSMSM